MRKKFKYLFVVFFIINLSFNFNFVYAAGSVDSGSSNKSNLYNYD